MYHLELRQFPHNHCAFNLTGQELGALALAWARGEIVEVGERKWSPHQARLTIVEGPRLPPEELSMGRGWRSAQRQGEDVSERVLAEAARMAQAVQQQAGAQAVGGAQDAAPADPLATGVQLAALLGEDPGALLDAWRAVVVASPGLAPSESLALAERQIASAPGNQG
jgi:hypothetical protein